MFRAARRAEHALISDRSTTVDRATTTPSRMDRILHARALVSRIDDARYQVRSWTLVTCDDPAGEGWPPFHLFTEIPQANARGTLVCSAQQMPPGMNCRSRPRAMASRVFAGRTAVPIRCGLDAVDDGLRDGLSSFRELRSIQPQVAISSATVGVSSLQTDT